MIKVVYVDSIFKILRPLSLVDKFVESCLKNIFKSNKVFHYCSLSHTLGRKGEGLESLRKLCKPQKLSCSSVRKVAQLKTVTKTFQNVYTG